MKDMLIKEKTNVQNIILNDRIETFLNLVEMYEDDEDIVQVYLFDFIAYLLSNNNDLKKCDLEYEKIILTYITSVKNDDEIEIKGIDLKNLYSFTKKYNLSNILNEKLSALYMENQMKIENKYELEYNYYNQSKNYINDLFLDTEEKNFNSIFNEIEILKYNLIYDKANLLDGNLVYEEEVNNLNVERKFRQR